MGLRSGKSESRYAKDVTGISVTRRGEDRERSAQIDQAEAKRRTQEAEDLLNKLRRRDPGGDVELRRPD